MTFIRQGGRAQLTHARHDGTFGRCSFPCQDPGSKGQTCSVPVRPKGAPHPGGHHWTYEGPADAPTLHPSVNCCQDACWHGWIRDGELVA